MTGKYALPFIGLAAVFVCWYMGMPDYQLLGLLVILVGIYLLVEMLKELSRAIAQIGDNQERNYESTWLKIQKLEDFIKGAGTPMSMGAMSDEEIDGYHGTASED